VQPGAFWKGLHNEIEVMFHTVAGNIASHECWYRATHYQMTQHHMYVSNSTQYQVTASHECQYISTQYWMTQHHMNVGTVPQSTR